MRDRDLRVLHEIVEVRGGFGHRARLHGAEDSFHETLTRAWLQCVAVHVERWGADGFEEFLERNPDLLNRSLIEHFYTRERLFSDGARASWVTPDVRRLPALSSGSAA